MSDSTLRLDDVSGVTLVTFRDNSILDVAAIQRIGRELYELVEGANDRRLILNFQNVRFLSSQALGVLLTLRRKAERTNAQIVLAELRPELARVFRITNLDRMFRFFDTKADACRHFNVEAPPESLFDPTKPEQKAS
jgi:anti-sigma B factor antagonist